MNAQTSTASSPFNSTVCSINSLPCVKSTINKRSFLRHLNSVLELNVHVQNAFRFFDSNCSSSNAKKNVKQDTFASTNRRSKNVQMLEIFFAQTFAQIEAQLSSFFLPWNDKATLSSALEVHFQFSWRDWFVSDMSVNTKNFFSQEHKLDWNPSTTTFFLSLMIMFSSGSLRQPL